MGVPEMVFSISGDDKEGRKKLVTMQARMHRWPQTLFYQVSVVVYRVGLTIDWPGLDSPAGFCKAWEAESGRVFEWVPALYAM